MNNKTLKISWPNNVVINANENDDWFEIAKRAGIEIPTGCLTGSCGACEIDVNGETIRPCTTNVRSNMNNSLNVEFTTDPFW